MPVAETVARNLRRIRKERKLSQHNLAARAGVDKNYVGMVERQEVSPSIGAIEKLAKALKIKTIALFEE